MNVLARHDTTKTPIRGPLAACLAGLLQLAALPAHAGFQYPAVFEVGGDIAPDAEVVDDVNGDGIDDIVVSLESKLMLLLGSTSGELDKALTLRFFYPLTGIATGDFNGDGAVDVVVQTYYGRVTVYENTATEPVQLVEGGSFNATSGSVLQATDFDEDGAVDLVVGGNVYYNDGSGGFELGEALPSVAPTGDVNGDGLPDIIKSTGEVLCGSAAGAFEPCALVSVSSGLHASADLDGEPGLEIVSWTGATYAQVARTYVTNHCGMGRTYRKRSGTRYVIRGSRYRRTTGCRWSTTIMRTVVASSSLVISAVAEDGSVTEWTSSDIPGVVGDLQVADFNADDAADVLATNADGDTFLYPGYGDGIPA